MKISKAIAACALAATAVFAQAQDWPTKPVKFIVTGQAGIAPDIIARVIGEKLTAIWGQPVVVENRVGAGGIPGMAAVKASPPDGYTFGVAQASVITLTPHLYKNPQFDFDMDFTMVANTMSSPLLIAVNPKLGVSTLPEFIQLAKSKPGRIEFAPPLLNSVPHLVGEQISALTGIKMMAVPYNGSGPATVAVIAGNGGEVTIDAPAPLMPNVREGKLKAIAITSVKRLPGFEGVPTVSETIPHFEATGWFGIIAPAKVPQAIVERVNRDINTVIQMPDVVGRFAPLALFPAPGTQPEVAAFVKADRERWARVVRDMGVKPE